MPKIKNIIIFVGIAAVFILIYIFFIKKNPDNTATLISSSPNSAVVNTIILGDNPSITQDFLSLLLSVKSIKLDDAIFSDNGFTNLHDSSITLTPDGNEGRPNPFAPLGSDSIAPPVNTGSGNTGAGTPMLPN